MDLCSLEGFIFRTNKADSKSTSGRSSTSKGSPLSEQIKQQNRDVMTEWRSEIYFFLHRKL